MREKDYLYDLLVHDLVGALSVVAATVNNLLSKAERYGPLSEPQRQCVERVQRNTHKAQGLIQDILEVARAEENLFHSSRFAIGELVREAILDALEGVNTGAREQIMAAADEAEVKKLLGRHGISWTISGRYASEPFSHDRKKVLQILRNLTSNALKYRAHVMDVLVSGDSELIIMVSNDGPGIPEQDREAAFKRFVRIQNGSLKDIPGLGLGLFCIKALVEEMHGEISIGSREGFSTCFTARIPFLEPSKDKEGRS